MLKENLTVSNPESDFGLVVLAFSLLGADIHPINDRGVSYVCWPNSIAHTCMASHALALHFDGDKDLERICVVRRAAPISVARPCQWGSVLDVGFSPDIPAHVASHLVSLALRGAGFPFISMVRHEGAMTFPLRTDRACVCALDYSIVFDGSRGNELFMIHLASMSCVDSRPCDCGGH